MVAIDRMLSDVLRDGVECSKENWNALADILDVHSYSYTGRIDLHDIDVSDEKGEFAVWSFELFRVAIYPIDGEDNPVKKPLYRFDGRNFFLQDNIVKLNGPVLSAKQHILTFVGEAIDLIMGDDDEENELDFPIVSEKEESKGEKK